MTDSTLPLLTHDGRTYSYVPYRPGAASSRREQSHPQRPVASGSTSASGTPSGSGTPRLNGAPSVVPATPSNGPAVSIPVQVKNLPSNISLPAGNRIPSGGAAQSPSTPVPPAPAPSVPSQVSLMPAVNGISDAASNTPPHVEPVPKLNPIAKPNGHLYPHPDTTHQVQPGPDMRVSPAPNSVSPSRPKSQNQQANIPVASNFQFPINGYPAHIQTAAQYVHSSIRPNGLSTAQQLQAMKAPFSNMNVAHDITAQINSPLMRNPASYIPSSTNVNDSAQMDAATRQMQWVAAAHHQQQQQQRAQLQRTPAVNVVDANGVDTSMAAMLSPPPLPNNSPPRVPSSGGVRPVMKPGMSSPALAHAMSPQGRASPANAHIARLNPHGHTSSPHLVSPSLAAAQAQSSPSRQPQPTLPSPSLQTRQAVGGSGAVGY